MAGNSAPLDGPALNSEIEALLAVEPLAGFNARVLAAATARPRRGLWWVLAPAGALAVAALVIALVIHLRSAGPANQTLAGRPFATPVAVAPWIPASPVIGTEPPTGARQASRRRAARHFAATVASQPTEPGGAGRPGRSPRPGPVARSRGGRCRWPRASTTAPLPLMADMPAPVRPLLPGFCCPSSRSHHLKTPRKESADEPAIHASRSDAVLVLTGITSD